MNIERIKAELSKTYARIEQLQKRARDLLCPSASCLGLMILALQAAALLFAVPVAGLPLGTAFLGSTVGANVFAQATEMASAKCQPVSV